MGLGFLSPHSDSVQPFLRDLFGAARQLPFHVVHRIEQAFPKPNEQNWSFNKNQHFLK